MWVGRMDSEKVEDSLDWPTAVGMGERVGAMMERVMSWVSERTLRASRGPKASRAWKAGKRRMPKLWGTVGGGVGV